MLFAIKKSDSTELYLVTPHSLTYTLCLATEGQNNRVLTLQILQHISSLGWRTAVNSEEVLIQKVFPIYKAHKNQKETELFFFFFTP